ncbi:MAG: phosphoadenosine phosphosulfate reductase, partial [Roseburia sp.]|nr:phosphoadenosine phosphosulfate reductase [Roseburia sp.]
MAGYLAGNVDEWIYIDVADQHPDSMRFIKDCEKAIGKKITVLRSTEYRNVEDCVRAFGGYKNPANGFTPCTNWLKKRIRKEWEYRHTNYEITYVWGFDLKETERAER